MILISGRPSISLFEWIDDSRLTDSIMELDWVNSFPRRTLGAERTEEAVDLVHIIINGLSLNFHSNFNQIWKCKQNQISRRHLQFGGKTWYQYWMSYARDVYTSLVTPFLWESTTITYGITSSVSGCACDDVRRLWVSDDVPQAVWFQQHRHQLLASGICPSVGYVNSGIFSHETWTYTYWY